MDSPIHRGLIRWLAFVLCAVLSTPMFALSSEPSAGLSLSRTDHLVLWALIACIVLCLIVIHRFRQLSRQLRARMVDREKETRALHDSLLQSMEALILRFQIGVNRISPDDPAHRMLEEALHESDALLEELRHQILGSSTGFEAAGLPEAFAAVCTELKREHPADFSVVVNGVPRPLQPEVRDEVYRIGREALTNSFHHANAARCETDINYDRGELRIGFRDDGCGVDPKILRTDTHSGHWGLPGMHQRARGIGAALEVWSRRGVGTEVEVRIPAVLAYSDSKDTSRWQWLRRFASRNR